MIIGSRSLHPRKLQVPPEYAPSRMTEAVHVEERNPAILLQSLLEQMTKRRCNADAAELLLTTMSTHFADLEANHRELVSVLMARIYLEVVTTEDPLVRLNLLQLVETRARLWRKDSAADVFYKNRKLTNDQQSIDTIPQPKVAAAPVTVVPVVSEDQLKPKSVRDKMHEQRLVVSDKVEIRLFSNCETSLQESFGVLQSYYRKKHLKQSQSDSSSKPVSSTNVTYLPEHKLSEPTKIAASSVKICKSSLLSTAVSSGQEVKPDVNENENVSSSSAIIAAPVKSHPVVEPAVDSSGATEVTSLVAVTKQPVERRRVIIQDFKTQDLCGVSHSKVSSDDLECFNGFSSIDSVICKDEINVRLPSLRVEPVSDSQHGDTGMQRSSKESGAGDCMKLAEKRATTGWARWQGAGFDLAPDLSLCNVAGEDADMEKLVSYPRDILVGLGTKASAKHLPRIWPDLCNKFKGVCLLPKEGRQVQLYESIPDEWTIFRPQQ